MVGTGDGVRSQGLVFSDFVRERGDLFPSLVTVLVSELLISVSLDTVEKKTSALTIQVTRVYDLRGA